MTKVGWGVLGELHKNGGRVLPRPPVIGNVIVNQAGGAEPLPYEIFTASSCDNPSGAARHLSCARPSVSTGVPLHKGGFGALYMTEMRAFIARRGEGTPPYEVMR